MTYHEFVQAIESYYFTYPDFVRNMVLLYVQKSFNENDLNKVFGLILKNYSRQYKNTPDVNIIDDIVMKHNKKNDFPNERIEYKWQITYITNDPQYKHLFAKQVGDK